MRNWMRTFGLLSVCSAAALGLAPPAGADTSQPVWTCRASAALVRFPDAFRIEPLVANGNPEEAAPDRAQCVDDDAGVPKITLPPDAGPSDSKIVLDAAFARTRITPDLGFSENQSALAEAGVANARIESPSSGFLLQVTAAVSRAVGTCNRSTRTATFGGFSSVAEVTLGSAKIPVNQELFEQIGNGINGSPLGQLLKITFNEEVKTGTPGSRSETYIRRAVHVQLFPGAQDNGNPVIDAVVGESKVGREGAACVPAGSRLGGPVQLPKIPIPGFLRSHPCARLKAFGPLLAMVGTNRRDLIAGTDSSDRIFALGGNDYVSSRRGNDCIEGGSGKDKLDGDAGRDRVYGGTGSDVVQGSHGRDRLYGGSGNDRVYGGRENDVLFGGRGSDRLYGGYGRGDRMYGGPGRDVINTQSSGDRVFGGSGNDYVNAAVAGRATRIDGGRGRNDFARVNTNEVRFVKRCERVMISRRIR